MHAGVLPDVERGEVEAERAHPAQHAPHVEQPGVLAVVGGEAVGDDLQVVDQLLDALVVAGTAVVGGAQPLRHLAEQHAIRHAVVARRRPGLRRRQQAAVLLDARDDLRRHGDAARALAQPLGECLGLEEVAIDDQLVVAQAALANGLGVHVRVAVHVAAHPAAEMQQLRHVHLVRGRAEGRP